MFYYTFIEQSAKEDTPLWVCQSLRTLHGQWGWQLDRLWTQHGNPTSPADIGLSHQLHMLL